MALTKAEITHLRGLHLKKNRETSGQFMVEGNKVVLELVAADHPFEALYATTDWDSPPGTDPIFISDAEMKRISHYPTPSPVLAVGRIDRAQLAEAELDTGLTLALDGIQDPGNVGTLLRIADWFGFARVVLSPDSADLFSQKVINASMGSFARIRVVTTNLPEVLASTSAPVLGCDLAGIPLTEVAPVPDGIVVIGSEGRGISPAVQSYLTRKITIPRYGEAESLNAAVAAGIVCAHLRQPA
ncbi:MAG: RNA methyltransferase [Synoicihabitans sp.]